MDRIERFVISVLVANHSGVLSRVSGMFTRRGFNIDTLTVGETESPEFSRITISTHCDRSRSLPQTAEPPATGKGA